MKEKPTLVIEITDKSNNKYKFTESNQWKSDTGFQIIKKKQSNETDLF